MKFHARWAMFLVLAMALFAGWTACGNSGTAYQPSSTAAGGGSSGPGATTGTSASTGSGPAPCKFDVDKFDGGCVFGN